MTTKGKIIGGFVIMVALIASVAGLGFYDIQVASDGFSSYRRQARVNVASSNMVTKLSQSILKTYDFLSSADPALIDNAHRDIDEFINIVNTALNETQIVYRKEALTSFKSLIEPLRVAETTIRSSIIALRKQFTEVVRTNYGAMAEQLAELGEMAFSAHNAELQHRLGAIWVSYAESLAALSRFSQNYTVEDGDASLKHLRALAEPIKELSGRLATDEEKKLYQQIRASHQKLVSALESMTVNANTVRDNLIAMHNAETDIMKAISEFSDRVDREMRAEGDAVLASNQNGQRVMLAFGIAGIVLGALLAVFIIIGIIRVLHDMARFSSAIANGDFDYQVKTHEKGEIGVMVASMRQIPATLKSVLDEYHSLETAVETGRLNAQGNATQFRGSFATLIRGTNAILGRFLTVLENIPSPLIVMDAGLKAAYLNAIARSLAGDEYMGKPCSELFALEDTNSDKDALKRAVTAKAPASNETRAHPRGKNMDISYTAIPMLDAKGGISSVMQFITDLTELKAQQNIMVLAASRASEISDRVAAAAEELSAQVEQISRGAEVQRKRVESTAGAMTEMNSTVLEVARSAGDASEQSENTRLKATEGAGLVNQVMHAINAVNNVGQNLQNNMQELGRQAESIGNVMNVISDIADQTNLLALNAAIEAARAGEAGRGFAVVADEVRKLAEKTMQATQEVGSSIHAVQKSARVNIDEVGKAVASVAEANKLANSSGEALAEIVNLAAANSSVVASIATAAEEQSATSEEISRAIDEINRIVGETTEGMTQSSHAVRDLSRMVQELNGVIEHLTK